jgi:hypothetical protein
MKKHILILFSTILLNSLNLKAQDSCITALPFCTGTAYDYDAPTGFPAPGGPDYGCLGSVANPFWFSIEVVVPGAITITGSALDFATVPTPIDVDFIYWGPFPTLSGACYTMLDASHILGCDYSGSNLINISIPAALPGEFYIAMISNYADETGNIHYEQTAGSGTTACGYSCSFVSLTASPSVCDSADNSYSVSGSVVFNNAPSTGTLTIFGSCGGSQTFNAPFTSPTAYTLSGLPSNASSCFVAAGFSDDGTCSINKIYTSPAVCNSNSIDEKAITELKLSPNPSNGIFDLSFASVSQDISIFITDVLGRTIYQETQRNVSGFYKKQMDISANGKGLYFVKILGENGSYTQKIICN